MNGVSFLVEEGDMVVYGTTNCIFLYAYWYVEWCDAKNLKARESESKEGAVCIGIQERD